MIAVPAASALINAFVSFLSAMLTGFLVTIEVSLGAFVGVIVMDEIKIVPVVADVAAVIVADAFVEAKVAAIVFGVEISIVLAFMSVTVGALAILALDIVVGLENVVFAFEDNVLRLNVVAIVETIVVNIGCMVVIVAILAKDINISITA